MKTQSTNNLNRFRYGDIAIVTGPRYILARGYLAQMLQNYNPRMLNKFSTYGILGIVINRIDIMEFASGISCDSPAPYVFYIVDLGFTEVVIEQDGLDKIDSIDPTTSKITSRHSGTFDMYVYPSLGNIRGAF